MKKVGVLLFVLFVCLVSNAQGIYQMWGTTIDGGAGNAGGLFRTDATGNNYQLKHSFSTGTGGVEPSSTALTEYNGKLYGMTEFGGRYNKGVIFELDVTTNIYTVKYDFDNRREGANPYGDLVLHNGKFYGTTFFGGYNDMGTIFEWNPSTNVLTTKFQFYGPAATGAFPRGSLTMNGGKFYGTTTQGGNSHNGAIFEWDPATNVYTKKIDFDRANGEYPQGRLTMYGGKFYGTASQGGDKRYGVIFEWDPATNVLTKKFDFNGSSDGRYPFGALELKDGKFYGGTAEGGTGNFGVLFEWDPATNIFLEKLNLNSGIGARFVGRLFLSGDKFYGAMQEGGSTYSGVIFEWDPVTNVYIKKFDFGATSGKYPYGNLMQKDGKFYGMTTRGGLVDSGVIFEWDPATNVYTKKFDFNSRNGAYPSTSLVSAGNKLYGMTIGGNGNSGVLFEWDPSEMVYIPKVQFSGTNGDFLNGSLTFTNGKFYGVRSNDGASTNGFIFEWDPQTNTYTKKFEFNGANGKTPAGQLVLNGGKFYGLTQLGGTSNAGVIFEWNPTTNVFTKKYDFNLSNGIRPLGNMALKDGKFYGTTTAGGDSGVGVLFEWDPATNVYTKKIDLVIAMGAAPSGGLVLKDGKFYGKTQYGGFGASTGGLPGYGVLFEWDPTTNIYTRKFTFSNGAGGPEGLMLSGGKFYGITQYSGANGYGILFEWDPVTNIYARKVEFSYNTGGSSITGLTLFPAPVAKGLRGTCINYPSVPIDNSNNNRWVAIVDNDGNAVGEIKANGNNLGIVNASMFINDGAVREDQAKRLYLDRNITITPQFQPSSPVDIRLYIRNSEYVALKNATASNGQSSGINTINDVGIFKNPVNICSPDISENALPVVTTISNWENDYVLSASITSFSSFYFANKTFTALPLNLLEFKGRLENNNGLLNWKTDNEQNTSHFEIERSTDGVHYTMIGNVVSVNAAGIHNYSFTDLSVTSLGVATVYYRLKQVDINKEFTYSPVVTLNIENENIVLFYPNPVGDKANLSITISQPERLNLRIIDNLGRVVKQQQWNLAAGNTSLSIDVKSLSTGLYYLNLKGTTINKQLNFIRQ